MEENDSKFIALYNEELWRLPKVLKKVPGKKSWFLDLVKKGIAPQGIKVGSRLTAWRASEIMAFVEKLATEGRKEAGK